jgi:hypothetical protein
MRIVVEQRRAVHGGDERAAEDGRVCKCSGASGTTLTSARGSSDAGVVYGALVATSSRRKPTGCLGGIAGGGVM